MSRTDKRPRQLDATAGFARPARSTMDAAAESANAEDYSGGRGGYVGGRRGYGSGYGSDYEVVFDTAVAADTKSCPKNIADFNINSYTSSILCLFLFWLDKRILIC